jgi:hypothetical protein
MSYQASLSTILDHSESWTWVTAFSAFVIVAYTVLGFVLSFGLVQLEARNSRNWPLKAIVVVYFTGVGWVAGTYVDTLFHENIWKGLAAVAITVVSTVTLVALVREVGPPDHSRDD